MALRHLLLRLTPRLSRRAVLGILAVVGIVIALNFVRLSWPAPPVVLVVLGAEGRFGDTVRIPPAWGDTATRTPDAVARFPLILGVRNLGRRPVAPERLSLSLPVWYRLTSAGAELEGRMEGGSPLVTYTLRPGFQPIEPERLPTMLPGLDTLWLEVIIPRIYCVAVGDSIPEFVPAPPPPINTLGEIRVFYSFEGGELKDRRTGTLTIGIDTTMLAVEPSPEPPTFPMRADPALARPELGQLRHVGSRRSHCGEPDAPMELLSTVWATPGGGRFITLDYGGTVRKHLYDLDGDGVIERESWAPEGDAFTTTRQARLAIPEFLLPVSATGAYDMARLDTLPPDSLMRLDPLRRAMAGPGPVPGGALGPGVDSVSRRLLEGTGAAVVSRGDTLPALEELPEPRVRPQGLLGRPIVPADTGG